MNKAKLLWQFPVMFSCLFYWQCQNPPSSTQPDSAKEVDKEVKQELFVQTGAEQLQAYLPELRGKTIALMVNPTSTLGNRHLVDTLLALGVEIKHIFAPEHGFRGTADAGEKIADAKDSKTGLPIISLYGNKKQPGASELEGVELVVFDIQDVGARFYTYISSMHYLMQGCAQEDVPLLVLDRPNPNGHYIDGPVLDEKFKSFVGMHPVPVVHGMTVGEYAQMINGEGWLDGAQKCELNIIPCKNYTHETVYELPIKPSPNLPNARSIYLYPSLCFFEGTIVSVGRGTEKQFQLIGHPEAGIGNVQFTPISREGATKPKYQGEVCRGFDLTQESPERIRERAVIDLSYLLRFYQDYKGKEPFFNTNNFFHKLAGTDQLEKQIKEGWTEEEIKSSWEEGLKSFQKTREQYLLYK